MCKRLLSWLGVALSLALSYALSSAGGSVLVVTDSTLDTSAFSQFWDGLRDRGYSLTFRKTSSQEPLTLTYEVPAFSHIIVFAPSTRTYPPDLSPQSLVHLLSHPTNPVDVLFVLQSSTPASPLRDLAREFGVSFPPPSTPLVDHFSAATGENSTTLFISLHSSPHTPSIVEGDKLIYAGVSHWRSNNPLLVEFLNAPVTSYAADPTDSPDAIVEAAGTGGEGLWAGAEMGLVTGFEVLGGGGRSMWVGSLELFKDSAMYFNGESTSNAAYALDLVAWTFRETSVYRIDSITHHRADETMPQDTYRIKDDIVYAINISKYDPRTSTWRPTSEINDLQLEFTMLDPHIRTALLPVPGKEGTYEAKFRAPDRHGVFKFIVDWRRKGYTPLHSSTTVSVVPFRHNEYPRFLSSAWPYYTGALSTSAGFVVFCAIWLLGDAEEEKKKKTQ